jgi:hypothetical protein
VPVQHLQNSFYYFVVFQWLDFLPRPLLPQ